MAALFPVLVELRHVTMDTLEFPDDATYLAFVRMVSLHLRHLQTFVIHLVGSPTTLMSCKRVGGEWTINTDTET
jgi:hypothetical protein